MILCKPSSWYSYLKDTKNVMVADYTMGYIFHMTMFYFVMKGIGGGMVMAMLLPLYQKHYDVGPIEYQQEYAMIVFLPWCFKTVFGYASDVLNLTNKRKKTYILGLSIISLTASLVFVNVDGISFNSCRLLLFTMSLCMSGMDLLHDASYVEKMSKAVSGPVLLQYIWIITLIGLAIGTFIVGVFSDYYSPVYLIWIYSASLVVIIVSTLKGNLKETSATINKASYSTNRYWIPTVTFTITSIISFFISNEVDELVYFIITTFFSILNIASMYLSLNYEMFKMNLYIFLYSVGNVDLRGATNYAYTDNCIGMPNFSYKFFIGTIGFFTCFFGIGGVSIAIWMSDWIISRIFQVTCLTVPVSGIFESLQIARINVQLGIPDHLFYFAGEAVFNSIANFIVMFNMFTLMTRKTKLGHESIQLAIMQSAQNFSFMYSTAIGNLLIGIYNIGECNFENLPYVIIFGKTVFVPFLVSIAVHLLPNDSRLIEPKKQSK